MPSISTPRRALLQRAEPWLTLLLGAWPTYSLARAGCVDSPVVIAVEAHVADALKIYMASRAIHHATDHELLRKVREAIDVLCLVIAIDPHLLWSPVGGLGKGLSWGETLAARSLERRGVFQLHVTLVDRELRETVLLERRLCQYFVETLDHEPSTHAEFRSVRDALVEELQASHVDWWARLPSQPAVIRTNFGIPTRLYEQTHSVENWVVGLEQFLVAAEALQPSQLTVKDQEARLRQHVPVCINHVKLSMVEVVLSRPMVQVIQRLQSIRKRHVVLNRVRVDPRTVRDSHDEMTEHLNLIADGNGLVVFMGPAERIQYGDGDGIDRANVQVCETIIHGISNCINLETVNLGELLELCQSPHSRRGVFRAMIEHLLSRAIPCNVVFNPATFNLSDGDILREEHARWQVEHPGAMLRVKKLIIRADDVDNAFACAMIEILDDMEAVRIHNFGPRASSFPESSVTTLLHKFESLRELDLGDADIASMDPLAKPRQTSLESIDLHEFRLLDRDSLTRFAHALGDSTGALGRSLRRLNLGATDKFNPRFRITEQEADDLANALVANHVLEDFETTVYASGAKKKLIRDQLMETERRAVATNRRSQEFVDELRRRAAFLSVVHANNTDGGSLASLDASVVGQIFSFSTHSVERRVEIYVRDALGERGSYSSDLDDMLDEDDDDSDEDGDDTDDSENEDDDQHSGSEEEESDSMDENDRIGDEDESDSMDAR